MGFVMPFSIFELMIEQHFPPREDNIIEIAITSFTQKARLQEGKKKANATSLIYLGMKGYNSEVFVSPFFLDEAVEHTHKTLFENS